MKNSLRFGKLQCVSLAALAVVSLARADDCADIRLDKTYKMKSGAIVEGSMVHVAVRNQRSIGSCYAHASAQMYDAWRFRHGEDTAEDYENFSSGFEIGQRFKINENEKIEENSRLFQTLDLSINGGFVKKLLPFLLDEGTCSQLELNGLFQSQYHLDVDTYASEVMRRFNKKRDEFHRVRDAIWLKYFPAKTKIDLQSSYAKALRSTAEKEVSSARKQFLDAGIAELRETHKNILTNPYIYKSIDYRALIAQANQWKENEVNTVKMFETISVIDCARARRRMTRGEYRVANTTPYSRGFRLVGENQPRYSTERTRAVLDAEFNKGIRKAYPVGIGYCASILREGRGFKVKKWDENECGRHASLVIGRRKDPKNAGRCQYLIRNSWGTGCGSYYSSDWECDGPMGSIWVDADTLGQATHDLQTLRTISD